MTDRLNPAEQTAAESDYQKKFNQSTADSDASTRELKDKEAAGGDASWKTATKPKVAKSSPAGKKGKFRFTGGRGGALRKGSAFSFVLILIGLGLWYTSFFAPNIMMVNIKEMYTNDLADGTIALDTYAKKLMSYKIGGGQCDDIESIKCKLSTMPLALKKSFEKFGFTVIGTKVKEDGRTPETPITPQPESRYKVSTIVMPTSSPGIAPIGDALYLWAKQSDQNKALLYGVFNPKSSFYMDARMKQRLKSKYDLTKDITVSGSTEAAVNKSFDSSMTGSNEGIDISGRPNANGGIGLGSLKNPVVAAQYLASIAPLAAQANSYVGLQCAYYSFGKQVTNDAKTAKAHTVARFAMQYLKAADQIKSGTSQDITINTLSSKLAGTSGGGYGGPNATDASMYKSIVHGTPPIPSPFGFLYYLDTFDVIGALFPAWTLIMASSTAVGAASGTTGTLSMPPANLTGNDRDYCLSGETTQSHTPIKNANCTDAITASAPLGFEALVAGALKVGDETCPPPQYDAKENKFKGEFITQPSLKATAASTAPVVAAAFGANVIAWANVIYPFFTSQTTGVAASDAIFAGTGEILGDMANSRGMTPANAATMTIYLAQKASVEKEYDDVARYNARKDPMNPNNKFSFIGSIVHGLTPTYDSKTPLFSTIANGLSLVGSGVKKLNPSADAIYYLQPDTFNPLRMAMCPDPEYLAIGITADVACNIRYAMTPDDLIAQPGNVIDYMTKSHSDAYQKRIDELTQRKATADPEADQLDIQRQLNEVTAVASKPFIDEHTGKPTPGSEYEKFMDYCVNRQDPWGRSALVVHQTDIPAKEKAKRLQVKDGNLNAVNTGDPGDPYQKITTGTYVSITEGSKEDQDWYTGKKCLGIGDQMLSNFRAFTMLCSVDGSYSGGVDCTDTDTSTGYANEFYTGNDILYSSWY
ncbi:MAG: iviTM7 [Candidatus Saccharibacteria bacterium]|nr:iviTM7 [Candidatus Saccharibacteria bacterium]